MSRVPLYLEPSPVDQSAQQFSVLSEEWSGRGEPHMKLGVVSYDPIARQCTFVPEAIWLSEGRYPAKSWSGGATEVEAELAPRKHNDIYTRLLFQSIESILRLRK